ncbi:MAG: response regulator [Deltaproteobacteria bacterium]|jgi:DNA-binding response OmpR family regulator|nr:response regulator [Deltaproteobacteria bacterium]
MSKPSKPSKSDQVASARPAKAVEADADDLDIEVEVDDGILIAYVDDDLELTRLVSGALEEEGWNVVVSNDGESGLEMILVEQPDMVILDVMMPGLTGWEICKYLRSKPDWKGTPILMLTGIGERMNALTAPLYGADAYLDKPFDLDDVVETVRQLLAQSIEAAG